MMPRVLMIAYHFPPLSGSSGLQRTLRFAQYLPDFGWQPIVLAPNARAYPRQSDDLMPDIAQAVIVRRSFALDTAKHLAVKGKYPLALALPDQWATWWLGAIPTGLQLIKEFRPHVIWSTYPIATAHLIGWTLQRLSGLPWVADMRDPLVQEKFPVDASVRSTYRWIERALVRRTSRIVCVTSGLARRFQSTYPKLNPGHVAVIENGFDEETFERVEARGAIPPLDNNSFTLVHSGLVYPTARDPGPLLAALDELGRRGTLDKVGFKLVFRASGLDDTIHRLGKGSGVTRWIALAPAIAYEAALDEMRRAHGLLLMQGKMCNDQIPAKLYEYLRARRPILALTDTSGDSSRLLRSLGISSISAPDSSSAIAKGLGDFIDRVNENRYPIPDQGMIARYSRKTLTAELGRLLDETLMLESRARAI